MSEGLRIVSAILSISEKEMRQSLREVKDRVRQLAAPILGRYDIPLDAAEIFFDLSNATRPGLNSKLLSQPSPMVQRQIEMCNRAFERMQLDLPEDLRAAILDSLSEEFRRLRSEMSQSRNTASQIATVLRPFSAKYTHVWRTDPRMADRLEFAADRIATLKQTKVNHPEDLLEWAADALQVFTDVVVWPEDTLSEKRERPMFTIRSSSERIYRVAWNAWIRQNLTAVLETAAILSDEVYTSPRVGKSAARSEWQLDAPLSTVALGAPSAPSTPAIKLTVSDINSPNLTTERSWNNLTQATREVSVWIHNAVAIWGIDEAELAIRLELNQGDGQLSISLPIQKPDYAAEAIIRAVQRLTN